jgi:iron complex transport system substrate-binding protein
MLFAIGAGPQVVAVDSYSNYPVEAPTTDLSAFEPNLEAITKYEPDLVITDGTNQQLIDQLNGLEIATQPAPAPKSLNGAFEQIEKLGAVTGNIAQAAQLVMNLEARVASILNGFPNPPGQVTYYYELDPTYFSAASKTFIGSVLAELDMKNIADEVDTGKTGGYPQLTPEFIVQADPDVILLADTKCCQQTPETVASRPGWADIEAVSEGHIIALDDDVASRWGPRIVDLLDQVADAVRGIEPRLDNSFTS